MKLEDQIKAAAELDGLKTWTKDGYALQNGCLIVRDKLNRRDLCLIDTGRIYHSTFADCKGNIPVVEECKPYSTSYDAIIPLIQKHTWNIKCEVAIQLRIVKQKTLIMFPTMDNLEGWCAVMLASTPAQLLEALLRATGKWEE